MASEEIFSEPLLESEDILYNKENAVEQAIEEIETTATSSEDLIQEPSTNTTDNNEGGQQTKESFDDPKITNEIPNNIKAKSTQNRLTQLPFSRVRNLMKLDPDLQIVSNEGIFVVTRATEMFIESLAKEAFIHTCQAKKKTVQKRDVDAAIESVDSLMFLEGAMNF